MCLDVVYGVIDCWCDDGLFDRGVDALFWCMIDVV